MESVYGTFTIEESTHPHYNVFMGGVWIGSINSLSNNIRLLTKDVTLSYSDLVELQWAIGSIAIFKPQIIVRTNGT